MPILGLLIVCLVLVSVGYRKKDKRLFFTGVGAFGLLITSTGAIIVLMTDPWGSATAIQMLVTGAVLGAGIAMTVLGVLGMVMPGSIWPDRNQSDAASQEKS
jgi:predicted phage tail protein